MAISLKHAFESAKADGGDNTLVRPSNWNAEHNLTMGTGKLLGRLTAGTGAAEELDIAYLNDPIIIAVSDETTALTSSGNPKVTFRMPFAYTVSDIRASLTTAQTSGNDVIVDVHAAGSTLMTTNKLRFDNGEKTTTSSSNLPSLTTTSIADDAEITIDIDQIGDGTAKGLKVTLIGRRT